MIPIYLRLFSGLEAALLHVYKHVHVKDLFELYQRKYNLNVTDLWPLFDRSVILRAKKEIF